MSHHELADKDIDVKLIELVKANPLIYVKDLRASPYDSVRKRTDLWKSIAMSLGVETKYCMTRWKNLHTKFRQELQKCRVMAHKAGSSGTKSSSWPLFEQMKFLKSHLKCYRQTHGPVAPNSVNLHNTAAEKLMEELLDDDPLQEAMDEQTVVDKNKEAGTFHSSTGDPSAPVDCPATLKQIESLLEGIGPSNRQKAVKRIVAYLCKCQLKSLNNEDIDEVVL